MKRDRSTRDAKIVLQPGEPHTSDLSGIGWLQIRTQQEVAELMGCTRQNIRLIERKALWKIRQAFRKEIEERKSYG